MIKTKLHSGLSHIQYKINCFILTRLVCQQFNLTSKILVAGSLLEKKNQQPWLFTSLVSRRLNIECIRNRVSPVCVRICMSIDACDGNDFLHCEQFLFCAPSVKRLWRFGGALLFDMANSRQSTSNEHLEQGSVRQTIIQYATLCLVIANNIKYCKGKANKAFQCLISIINYNWSNYHE